MLTDVIESCPDDLWERGEDGHPIWQIVYHTLAGTWVLMRPVGEPFQEPPQGEEVAELKTIPQYALSKDQVIEFAAEAKNRAESFIAVIGKGDLQAPLWHYDKYTNLDIILGQIRHIQHHVGYCNRILGERGIAVSWREKEG